MSDCHICGESISNPERCDCASEMMSLCMLRDEYREALEQIAHLDDHGNRFGPSYGPTIARRTLNP